MIIQTRGSSLLLITQPDHAALAGRIMRRWADRGLASHARRESIFLAIDEHDNGWREVDAAPIVDPESGRILDFVNAPGEVRRGIWPRGVARLAADPWAAALVANHALHVYRHYRDSGEWAPFFVEMQAARDLHLRHIPSLTLDHLLADYFFVRMGDLLSLTFCNAWSDAPDELGYEIRCADGRLSVAPDPFAGQEIQVEVAARELPDRSFASAEDAARTFAAACAMSLTGTAAGTSRLVA